MKLYFNFFNFPFLHGRGKGSQVIRKVRKVGHSSKKKEKKD